jgi:hypothetical protein
MIPCQLVAQSGRKRQDPLTNRHDRKHMVDQVRRALRHASAPAARTDCAASAREGDEQVLVAPITLEASEPAREEPAPEKALEVLFDESGKAGPVAHASGLCAERLEMLAYDLIQDTVCWRTWLVGRGRTGHTPAIANRVPERESLPDTGNSGRIGGRHRPRVAVRARASSVLEREFCNIPADVCGRTRRARQPRNLPVPERPLQSATTAATVGSFAETKEQLGGDFLIDAADLDEAIRIASKWPSSRLGTIEVRPVGDELRTDRRYR